MSFDYAQARTELEEAARRRDQTPLPTSHPWMVRLKGFTDRAEISAKTHIAMLGTAILAQATDPAADLSRLTVASKGSYYARGLADRVLAQVAPLLNIDLGAKGAYPLNNSPYRGPKTLSEARDRVRSSLLPLFDDLLGIVDDLTGLSRDEARDVLQAFVQLRTREKSAPSIPKGAGGRIPLRALIVGISEFVASRSEGGKRAQATAAGVLDSLYGEANVRVDKVNDPSLDFPGDVKIMLDGKLAWSLEVRDKPVNLTESLRFLQAMGTKGHTRAAILAISSNQELVALQALEQRAANFDVTLRVFATWRAFVEEIVFHAEQAVPDAIVTITDRVLARCHELEVSQKGINEWRDIVLAIRAR